MPFADFLPAFLPAFFVDFLLALVFLPAADLRAVLLAVALDDLEAVDFFALFFLAGDFLERFEPDFELDFVDFLVPDRLAFFVAMVCLSLPHRTVCEKKNSSFPVNDIK